MNDKVLKTSADDLYELVKAKKKISIDETAKLLKMPVNAVHALVDFLVEEKIFGIEYKFTTPFIYISREKPESVDTHDTAKKIVSKDEFFKRARKWNISFETIDGLWNKYVNENLESIKVDFYRKSRVRKLSEDRINQLWIKYLRYLR